MTDLTRLTAVADEAAFPSHDRKRRTHAPQPNHPITAANRPTVTTPRLPAL